MKNKSNIALIVAACTLVLGIALSGFAVLFTGGVYGLNYSLGKKLNITHYSLFETNWSKHNKKADNNIDMKTQSFESFNAIDVSTSSVDIFLIESDSCKVEYQLSESEKLEICEVVDGTLKIRTDGVGSIGIFFGDFEEGFINIYYDNKAPLLSVLSSSESGNITLADAITVDGKLSLSTISGDMKSNIIRANTINYATTSGTTSANDITANSIKCESISGDIEADTVNCDEFSANSTSGEISVKSGEILSKTEASTVSGDISLMGNFFKTIDTNSTSGNVYLKSTQSIDDYDYSLNTVSGDKLLNWDNLQEKSNPSADNKLTVSTVSGDINLQFGIV